MTNDQPLTMTVEQAAKVLGIGRTTAYELVRTGDIPSVRLGRRIVVPIRLLASLLGIEPDYSAAPDIAADGAALANTLNEGAAERHTILEPEPTLF